MKKNEHRNLQRNADRFTGAAYVNLYDTFRPSPPLEIIHQTLNYANISHADTLVDLGCGTGISTEIWSRFSKKAIGIEPSEEMIALANKKQSDNCSYLVGYAHAIPLPSASVDIVTCSQSFHWMEPQSTLNEIDRILKNNGVLVIYDVIWPPSVNIELEKSYTLLFENVSRLTHQLKETIAHKWNKQGHFLTIKNSGYFNFLKESYYHKTETFDKEQFIGIALSQGGLEALLKRGFSEEDIGISKFKNEVARCHMLPYNEITYNYKVIFAVK